MQQTDRMPRLLEYLTLALAGACLTAADFAFLPEMPLLYGVYLFFLWYSYRSGPGGLRPLWSNVFALLIVVAIVARILFSLRPADGTLDWTSEIPLPVILIPYLGPVLMALLLVRLFQPPQPGGTWVIHGLGFLQVCLGGVLASGGLFAGLLVVYLIVAICAVAAQETVRQQQQSASVVGADASSATMRVWGVFGLRWVLAMAFLAVPLFLVTPRTQETDWDPIGRFGMQPTKRKQAKVGFSEEIDLTRSGQLEADDTIAFTVRVTGLDGQPISPLRFDQRWRGVVLDRYEDGMWRSELVWPVGSPLARSVSLAPARPDDIQIGFRISGKTGGLFLADPLRLTDQTGAIPIRAEGAWTGPLFFEAGGTATARNYLPDPEYRYTQFYSAGLESDRYPVVRVREGYLLKLVRLRPVRLASWTRELLQRLSDRASDELKVALERDEIGRTPAVWEETARLLTAHLARSGEYTYGLTLEQGSPSEDPVLDFLINVRHGHCERYAAALALMLRSQGIPSRVIKGYRGAELQSQGVYVVRNSNAHAWVEAIVPAQGQGRTEWDWIVLDATPELGGDSDAFATMVGRRWRDLHRTSLAFWRELILGYNSERQADLWADVVSGRLPAKAAPWVGVSLGLLVGLWVLRRIRRQQAKSATGGMALLARMQEVLKRSLGIQGEASETAGELAERARVLLMARPETVGLADVPGRVVQIYYHERYGGRACAAAEIQEVGEKLEELLRVRR